MSISFDELFAMRLQIQDITTDEVVIIKRLKLLLLSAGMINEEINNYLVDFYKYFGTTMSLEEIQEINVNENSFLNFLLNNQLDGSSQNNNQTAPNETAPNETEDNNNQDDNDNQEDNDVESSDDEIENSDDELENQMNEFHEEYEDIEQLNNPSVIPTVSIDINPLNLPNIPNTLPNIMIPQLQNTVPNILLQNSFDILGEFMNTVTYLPAPTTPVNYEPIDDDVIVTLDDNDLDNLKIEVAGTKLDDRCTICLMDIEQDNEIINLKCKHTFHSNCLTEYLKNYGYSCPVCRTEVGKTKAHID